MKTYKVVENELDQNEELDWLKKVKELTQRYHDTNNASSNITGFKKEEYLSFKNQSNLFNYSKFITPMWQKHYDYIESLLLNGSEHFLQDDLVQYAIALSIGGAWQQTQIAYLEEFWGGGTTELLKEDSIFYPTITQEKYFSSETLINHLSHLTFFSKTTGVKLNKLKCIIEFGGGYGSMTRLIRRMNPTSTQIVLDLPIFCFLQECYIRNIYGEEDVNVLTSENDTITEGKVNLIPIGHANLLKTISTHSPDIFVATWSLSEANKHSHQYIYDHKYFSSKYIFAGYRYYLNQLNPLQPCSESLKLTSDYHLVCDQNTFYADNQNYLIAKL